MWPKNRAATRSAAEQHELGCPLPAAVVVVMEWMRSWFAIPERVSTVVFMQIFIYKKLTSSAQKERRKRRAARYKERGIYSAAPLIARPRYS